MHSVYDDRLHGASKLAHSVKDVHVTVVLICLNTDHALRRRPSGGAAHGMNIFIENPSITFNSSVVMEYVAESSDTTVLVGYEIELFTMVSMTLAE
jgi:hypothetical protein